MQQKRITLSGVGDILLERSMRAKRITLCIRPFKGVRIAVPRGVSFTRAAGVAAEKAAWLKKHLARMALIEKQMNAQRPTAFVDPDSARRFLKERLAFLAAQYGFVYNRVFVRNQKTRWGSCSHKNNISLNIHLIQLPGRLIDYVLLHELMHIRVKQHGRLFWDALTALLPDARALDEQLRHYWILPN